VHLVSFLQSAPCPFDYRNARCFLLGYLNCIHTEECRAEPA